MEDRATPILYLELGNRSTEDGATRARDLAAHAGVQRVTWWANCAFERTDLPMRIPDGRTLVVVEADERFAAPSPAPDATHAHGFRRHARPSQGILTGRPTLGLSIVWIGPRTADLDDTLARLG